MGYPPIITCVYKSAPVQQTQSYSIDHVYWLAEQVKQHVSIKHQFICLTDAKIPDIETRPLLHNLPGWWSKLELFRAFDSAFYLDLDTVLLNDISEMIIYPHTFTALRDLNKNRHNGIGSGVMAWSGGHKSLFQTFMKRHHHFMQAYNTAHRWGDQGFIQDNVQNVGKFQDLFPFSIESYKFDIETNPKPSTSIVCFHGKPRPWDVQKTWIPVLKSAKTGSA